ncbi:MAG: sigma-70 family RNA polymerase sigma factor [Prevotella sp.]|nr:sigma-70 family RNA polymerase sigma factor [Prevotella sp.]
MTRSEFEHIAMPLRQRVLKVCLDFFGNREDAEDAAQDAMALLWRYLEHIDAGRNVEALVIRMAKNCCINIYRRQQRKAEIIDINQQALRHQSDSASPQEQLEADDAQRMLAASLDLLSPRERQLFEMRRVEGLSTEDIARQTGIPKPSVAAMVSAARKKVLTELKRRMKQ